MYVLLYVFVKHRVEHCAFSNLGELLFVLTMSTTLIKYFFLFFYSKMSIFNDILDIFDYIVQLRT